MYIFKVNLVILYLCIVKSECGFFDAVLGTVKNTTNAIRVDIHNAVSYGNDLVFGQKKDQMDPNVNKGPDDPEGFFTGLYHSSVNKIHEARQRLRNIFAMDNTDRPHKGLITKMFDSVTKKMKDVQDYFESTSPPSTLGNPIDNPYVSFVAEDTKVVRDNVINILHRNNSNVFNKLNISESDLLNLFKDFNVTAKDNLVLPTVPIVPTVPTVPIVPTVPTVPTTAVNEDVALDIDIRIADVN